MGAESQGIRPSVCWRGGEVPGPGREVEARPGLASWRSHAVEHALVKGIALFRRGRAEERDRRPIADRGDRRSLMD